MMKFAKVVNNYEIVVAVRGVMPHNDEGHFIRLRLQGFERSWMLIVFVLM